MAALLLWPLPWTRAGSKWGSSELAAQPAAQRADRLQIEKVGGVAPFGDASHLKSRGEVALSDLSVADRQAVDELFRRGGSAPPSGPDAFSYRITRQTAAGPQTIVVPENAVPERLKNSVKDVIE